MNIKRFRGDTTPVRVRIKKKGAPLDITGYTFKWTVHSKPAPTASEAFVFQKTGAIEDAANGLIKFDLSVSDADRVGNFYYDMELTDAAGKVLTFKYGRMEFVQDITK